MNRAPTCSAILRGTLAASTLALVACGGGPEAQPTTPTPAPPTEEPVRVVVSTPVVENTPVTPHGGTSNTPAPRAVDVIDCGRG